MPITERPYKPRLYCPNCTQPLPPDAYQFTFCSALCMEEFDDILTPSEWDELDEEESERRKNDTNRVTER